MKAADAQPGQTLYNMFGGPNARMRILSPAKEQPDGTVSFLSDRGQMVFSPSAHLVPGREAEATIRGERDRYSGKDLNPRDRDYLRRINEMYATIPRQGKEPGE